MSVSLTIQGVTYTYPSNDSVDWGVEATNWAIGVTDALAIAVQQGDIGSSTQVIILETATNQNVTNLVFDSGITRGSTIDYFIVRTKGSNEYVEYGTLRVIYKTQTNTWIIEKQRMGDESNVSFDINSNGQVLYTSTPVAGTGVYSGVMRFRARSILT